MSNELIVTSGGLEWIRDVFIAARNDLGPQPPQYIVVGSGIAAASSYVNQVPGETFRASITNRAVSGTAAIFSTFLGPSDNQNQTISSYGLVGGKATATTGTGTLIAIANEPTPYSMDGTQTAAIDLILTVSGIAG